jgi:hypothetical protein
MLSNYAVRYREPRRQSLTESKNWPSIRGTKKKVERSMMGFLLSGV